jgi:hypothetical protein
MKYVSLALVCFHFHRYDMRPPYLCAMTNAAYSLYSRTLSLLWCVINRVWPLHSNLDLHKAVSLKRL